MEKPIVFVSYSHKDEIWKDRLRRHLGVLEREDRIAIWHDRQIEPTAEWYDEIKRVMAGAAVAICLISADYLDSEFCTKEEIPYLLHRRKTEGMHLLAVLLRPCLWKAASWLRPLQLLPRDGKTITGDYKDDWDTPFAEVAECIFSILSNPNYRPPAPPPPEWLPLPEERVDIVRLPVTGAELFGREAELELLNEAWETATTHVLSLIAWGGVGKSTLVNRWLEGLKADNWRGARRVYGWSFYSQGTGERASSADEFIADALRFFGDPDPTQGSPWSKAERLADLVRKEKALLVLDGLEPLQSFYDFEKGRIKDLGLARLIEELARENRGLCLITTRERVAELDEEDWRTCVQQIDLEQISPAAGRALLRVKGVRGSDAELEHASRNFGNHALAINLLANWLRDTPGHPIAAAKDIPNLDVSLEKGRHPRRVMAAFAARFGDGPEIEVLRMLGLFDRPTTTGAIAALCNPPPIPGLTEHVLKMDEAAWLRLLKKLRDIGLVAPDSRHTPDEIDSHPLVREHYAEYLRDQLPLSWQEAHRRLYYVFCNVPGKQFPGSLADLSPLFEAARHGCYAGLHRKVLNELYKARVQRWPMEGQRWFLRKKLGALSTDLALVALVFDKPWHRPHHEVQQAFVLNESGFLLRSLGRLRDAISPMGSAAVLRAAQGDFKNGARSLCNLSEIFLFLGELSSAFECAEQSLELASRPVSDENLVISASCMVANIYYHQGQYSEATRQFRQAEELQARITPYLPRLFSVRGFHYCSMLLDDGLHNEVIRRYEQSQSFRDNSESGLFSSALANLSLGQANITRALREHLHDFTGARNFLDHGIECMRHASNYQYLPYGLVTRAALHRMNRGEMQARRDLEETMRICKRCGMRLHECDAHLEYARLELAVGNEAKARQHAAIAKRMVNEMGYHRRDREVAELEARFGIT